MRHAIVTAVAAFVLSMPVVGNAQAPVTPSAQNPVREISKITGEIYRFRNNNHFSVFAVTPAGIIATDPINAAAATWLKDELKKRWPDRPIKFVVYSHDHADHISGGEVWADTATVVAHDNAKEVILGEKRPTAVPQVTLSDRATLELGGTVVELIYLGRNHSNNSLVMRFPKEKVIFAVDFIPVNSVAFRDFPDAYLDDWIDSLRRVEALEFDILAPGHGALGNKANVTAFRNYLEDLRAQVLAAARAGKSLDDTKKAVDLSKYRDWGGYEQMSPLNIEGVYRLVQGTRRPN
ncbi:MAG: MBL fold metallo-hydrolase [Alphaproteobacteria bacterium]|nr:MBL fold metallo-hydrolase [Alphaproteobacteria bacterium]